MPRQTLIDLRRGTAAAWTSADPTLAEGEPGFETDTGKIKFGDGSTVWTSLPYFTGSVATLAEVLAAGNETGGTEIAAGPVVSTGSTGAKLQLGEGSEDPTPGGNAIVQGGAGAPTQDGGYAAIAGGQGEDEESTPVSGASITAYGGGADGTLGKIEITTDGIDGALGSVLTSDGIYATWVPVTGTLNFVVDGGGSTVTTGIKGDVVMPFAGIFSQNTILADQTGDIEFDIWNQVYGSYPPTVTESIVASAPPAIVSGLKSQDSTLTGWTTAFAAGDVLRISVTSATSITRATLALDYTKQ